MIWEAVWLLSMLGQEKQMQGVAYAGSSVTEVAWSSVSSFACLGDDKDAKGSNTEVLVDDGNPGTAGVWEQTSLLSQ